MTGYLFVILWVGLCAILSKLVFVKRKELVCGVEEERYSWLTAFIVFLPLIIVAGSRGKVFDTTAYINWFTKTVPSSLGEAFSIFGTDEKDKGFYLLSSFIKSIFGNDYHVYLMIIAAIQGLIILSIYRKYSINYVLSVFLFVASVDYIGWMFNGTRQFLAVTMVFAATPLILKKKYFPLLCIILLAFTVHRSALIMIPIILICQGKVFNKRTVIFIVAILLAVAFLGSFTNLLDNALADTDYAEYSDQSQYGGSTNFIKAIIFSIPFIIAIIGRKKLQEEDNPIINFSANMSIITSGLYIMAAVLPGGVLFGRLPIFASLYNYILLPWEVEKVFSEKSKPIVYSALIIGYLAYFYYQTNVKASLLF